MLPKIVCESVNKGDIEVIFRGRLPFSGAFFTPEISAAKVLLENLEKLLKND